MVASFRRRLRDRRRYRSCCTGDVEGAAHHIVGKKPSPAPLTFQPALRRRVRERDIFFFGTAMGASFLGLNPCIQQGLIPCIQQIFENRKGRAFVHLIFGEFRIQAASGLSATSPSQSGAHNGASGRSSINSSRIIDSKSYSSPSSTVIVVFIAVGGDQLGNFLDHILLPFMVRQR